MRGAMATTEKYSGFLIGAAMISSLLLTACSGGHPAAAASSSITSGTVTGLNVGSSVVLQVSANGTQYAQTVSANGSFQLQTPIPAGASFTATIGTQPTGETCTVASPASRSTIALTCLWNASMYSTGGVRGFNQPGDLSQGSMAALAASGANVVRYFIEVQPLETSPGDQSTMTGYTWNNAQLASIVASAASDGFKVIVTIDDSNGGTRGLMFGSGTQATQIQSSMASIWESIATTYKGNTAIAGYDLFNEPVAPSPSSLWTALATSLLNSIRTIDPQAVIIYESPGGAGDFATLAPLPYQNVVYSFHDYDPKSVTAQGVLGMGGTTQDTYPGPNTPDINALNAAQNLALVESFQAKYNVPILVGEFSCVRWAPIAPNGSPSAYNWVKDTTSLFEAQHWAWNYHSWADSWYGWDAQIPSSFFYQYPYTNASPFKDLNGDLWNGTNISGIMATQATTNTNTFQLLESYYSHNAKVAPVP